MDLKRPAHEVLIDQLTGVIEEAARFKPQVESRLDAERNFDIAVETAKTLIGTLSAMSISDQEIKAVLVRLRQLRESDAFKAVHSVLWSKLHRLLEDLAARAVKAGGNNPSQVLGMAKAV